ncbi:hypothetical protein [Actinomadura sp. NPDC000929]|uniref:hypothetical protein n=1 Tax=Actinomadura sp. NPDC000929 TaxID=3154517 RepID=UPI0033955D22
MSTFVRRAGAVSAASGIGGVIGWYIAELAIHLYDRPDFIAVIPVGVGGGLLGVLLGLGFRSSEGPRIAARWIVVALLVIQLGNYFLGGPFVFSIAVVGFLLIFVIGQIIGQITGAFSGE